MNNQSSIGTEKAFSPNRIAKTEITVQIKLVECTNLCRSVFC